MIEDLNVVDLFCGCGGMSLGFKRQGFKVSAAFDNWAHAVDVYNKNLGDHAQLLDLGSAAGVEKIAKIDPDIILGGPPCQDFSSARANEITGNRANLVTNYCNIVDAAQPSYFVFENVPRVRFSPLYLDMKFRLGSAGYRMSEMIINAKHYKVPQSRKRLILIGAKNAREGEFSEIIESLATKKEITIREHFGSELNTDYYFRVPTNYNRRGVFSVDEPSQTIRGVERPIPTGYPGHKLDPVEISDAVRCLTIKERAQIQTFPSDFQWSNTKGANNLLIGNAVPVRMAEMLASVISRHITENSVTGQK